MERIDIGQARKRAKELLRAWRAEGRPGRLADAQWEIARGLGMPSWPALVRRAEAEAVEREQRHEMFVLWATSRRDDRARAMLEVDPALARAGLDTALLLGDREWIAPTLARPDEPLGHRDWPPLVYVCHSAFLGGECTDALLACAEALLDAGASPDAAWQHQEYGSTARPRSRASRA
jgi:hypothetical protein